MKYCASYHRGSNFKYLNEVDEISISYRREDTTLPTFLEKYINKVIIIQNVESCDIERLTALYEKYHNFKLSINFTDYTLVNLVREAKLPFMFSNYINTWDMLIGAIDLNPTDVYIVNGLGFEIDKVASIAHAKGIQIRAFPNFAQADIDNIPEITKFFIRPEDVDEYEPYIDVLEFISDDESLSTYYEVYAQDKKWFGQLNEIIPNLNSFIDNRRIISAFAPSRIKCGKKCLKGGNCNICNRVEHLAQTLQDRDLIFQSK